MATHDRSGFPEPTDSSSDSDTDPNRSTDAQEHDQGHGLRLRLREAGVTIVDAVTTKTGLRPTPAFCPDGDWVCDDDGPRRKTWARRNVSTEERVQLYSSGLSGTWVVEHQRPDGKSETVESDLEREAAFKEAERYMASVSGIRPGNRTGRAAQ